MTLKKVGTTPYVIGNGNLRDNKVPIDGMAFRLYGNGSSFEESWTGEGITLKEEGVMLRIESHSTNDSTGTFTIKVADGKGFVLIGEAAIDWLRDFFESGTDIVFTAPDDRCAWCGSRERLSPQGTDLICHQCWTEQEFVSGTGIEK